MLKIKTGLCNPVNQKAVQIIGRYLNGLYTWEQTKQECWELHSCTIERLANGKVRIDDRKTQSFTTVYAELN